MTSSLTSEGASLFSSSGAPPSRSSVTSDESFRLSSSSGCSSDSYGQQRDGHAKKRLHRVNKGTSQSSLGRK